VGEKGKSDEYIDQRLVVRDDNIGFVLIDLLPPVDGDLPRWKNPNVEAGPETSESM
jgi:hypothetical protein